MNFSRQLILLLFFSTFLFANIYDSYELNVKKEESSFMSNDFEEIIRFESLLFNGNTLDSKSSKYLQQITQKIQTYQENKKNITISIIGHSSSTNEKESILESTTYATKVQSYFQEQGIDTKFIVIEARGAKDPLLTSNGTLSNRVMVSMYVTEDPDKDKDGVFNNHDKCPNTKPGVKVSSDGCKLSTIIMLMNNHKKENAIAVKSANQESVIDQANTFVSIGSDKKMSAVSKMSDEYINSLFGNVVKASNVKHYNFILYFSKTKLLKTSQEELSRIIELLSNKDDYYIRIAGYTDTKGSAKYNIKLSQKRAELITQKIKEGNVKYLDLSTEFYGEKQLAIPTEDGVDEALNRRVEISIH